MVVDESSVADDELLWRRIHLTHYVGDGQGGMKVSTAAFRDTAMSVDRVGIVQRLGHDVAFTQQSGAGVAEFTAAFARVLNQQVEATPIADNPAHAEVLGAKPKQVQRQFVEQMVFRST